MEWGENWYTGRAPFQFGTSAGSDARRFDCCQRHYRAVKIIDISDKMDADGTLNWNAPAKWTILRMGRMSTGSCTRPGGRETTGLDVDKFTEQNLKFHFDHMAKPLLDKPNVLRVRTLSFSVSTVGKPGRRTGRSSCPKNLKNVVAMASIPGCRSSRAEWSAR